MRARVCEDSESSQAKKMKSYCAVSSFSFMWGQICQTSSGYSPTGTCWSVIVKYNAKSDFGVN